MKKYILIAALVSLPASAKSKVSIYSELLIGKANNNLTATHNFDLGASRTTSPSSESGAFRLGLNVTDYIAFEVAKHSHGESVSEYVISIPNHLPGNFEASFNKIINLPVELESIRLGFKGELELHNRFIVNAGVGIARWEYQNEIPAQLVPTDNTIFNNSGTDIYTSLGIKYKITKKLYLGLEYSRLNISETLNYDYTGEVKYQHNLEELSAIVGWRF